MRAHVPAGRFTVSIPELNILSHINQGYSRDAVAGIPRPGVDRRTHGQRRILFAKLGSFSYTNEMVREQLHVNFPNHDVETFDVKDYIKRRFGSIALNALLELVTYGPGVLTDPTRRHAFFFLTPFMFRHLSSAIARTFGPRASSFAFAIQTQGLFCGRIPTRPLLIYTDYTALDWLDDPGRDPRMAPPKAYLRYEAELYTRADAVATSGSHVERTLIGRYGCDPARVRTVHIGANVDIVPVDTDRSRYAAKHILFVGVEWERKGGPAMVEAFIAAARDAPDAHLTIVGCSPKVSHPQVTVAGRVPREQMPAYFKAASIFCMPSVTEPLGIAAVEASLFRLPVIATRINGFFETVTDGETGILVAPNDPVGLAGAMRRLFQDPDLGRQMGLAGFERNRAVFRWDEVGRRLRAMALGLETAA
jgi:glycosyltransferase involved in cell wall biosynthesis